MKKLKLSLLVSLMVLGVSLGLGLNFDNYAGDEDHPSPNDFIPEEVLH